MDKYLTAQEVDDVIEYFSQPENEITGFSSEQMKRYFRWKQMDEAAEYQGKKVTLNKPFRTSGESSKFGVYVKNDKGNVVLVRFGDPNMEIKRDDPERRKSFRARHSCDEKKDKTSAGYWSCRQWRANAKVEESEMENLDNTNMENTNETLDEAISRSERIKRGLRMRRKAKFLQRRAEISARRMPSTEKLMKRSRRLAERLLKKRIARKDPSQMSPAEKTRVEDRVRKMGSVVDRLARKLLPKVKQHAMQRMRSATAGDAQNKAATQKNESFIESIRTSDALTLKEALKAKMEKIACEKCAMKAEEGDKDPCWKGYEMVGMKKKGSKEVPNCVPKESVDEAVTTGMPGVADFKKKSKEELDKEHKERMDIINKGFERLKKEKEARLAMKEGKQDYTVYHKTFSSAVQHAIEKAESRGFEVDMDDWHNKVATGPKKPSEGKTNSYSIELKKNGKEVKQKLQMQVYGMGNKYELNMYIS